MQTEIELDSHTRAEEFSVGSKIYRARRRLVALWKRLVHWEFWPPWMFYPPVIAYSLYLGLRFRGFTLFTAANPGMPAGGFVGESKNAILRNLDGAKSFLPRSLLLSEGELAVRVKQANVFMEHQDLNFPIVLKPDAGQRGAGVAIVRSSEQLLDYLGKAQYPTIVQEYVSGKEFGVFYVRYPNQSKGRIFSVTEKRMPVVVGDGRRTLEELILADDRAACMAKFYLTMNSERRHEVVRAGESVQLVEIGTHCRGAIFLDGSYAVTPALQEAIQQIADSFDGFFFGRFDIRVPSLEDFMAARNLKVIELNGVTSEATHIYDPNISLFNAYRVLFDQWRIAFEIGRQNRDRGVPSTPVLKLIRMVLDYRELAREYPA
jgi:hypothetical protein